MNGIELRDKGMKQALDNANDNHRDWSAKAYSFLLEFINNVYLVNDLFMAEDIRRESKGIVPEPPSNRAWGAIIRRAVKDGLIQRNSFKSVKNPKAHATPATEWQIISLKPHPLTEWE
tara:strand:- start:772 stop:1125 length:354 start_codon:yes stop_codon:yes gene_type:complete